MKRKRSSGLGKGNGELPPISLALGPCDACGHVHPKPKSRTAYLEGASPFMTVQHVAGFLGKKVSSIYSEKSRRQLPPCLPGKKNPVWDPCVIAIFLYEGRIEGPTVPWRTS